MEKLIEVLKGRPEKIFPNPIKASESKIDYKNVRFADLECTREEAIEIVEAYLTILKAGGDFDVKMTQPAWTNIISLQLAVDSSNMTKEQYTSEVHKAMHLLMDNLHKAMHQYHSKMSHEEKIIKYGKTDKIPYASIEWVGPEFLLYVRPPMNSKSEKPIEDEITHFMRMAFSEATECNHWKGHHTAPCGTHSTASDYLLKNGMKTNSLCVMYLASYRDSISKEEWMKLKKLAEHYNRQDIIEAIDKHIVSMDPPAAC